MCICRTTCSYSCAAVDSISADTARRAVRLQVCVALAGQEQSSCGWSTGRGAGPAGRVEFI